MSDGGGVTGGVLVAADADADVVVGGGGGATASRRKGLRYERPVVACGGTWPD